MEWRCHRAPQSRRGRVSVHRCHCHSSDTPFSGIRGGSTAWKGCQKSVWCTNTLLDKDCSWRRQNRTGDELLYVRNFLDMGGGEMVAKMVGKISPSSVCKNWETLHSAGLSTNAAMSAIWPHVLKQVIKEPEAPVRAELSVLHKQKRVCMLLFYHHSPH